MAPKPHRKDDRRSTSRDGSPPPDKRSKTSVERGEKSSYKGSAREPLPVRTGAGPSQPVQTSHPPSERGGQLVKRQPLPAVPVSSHPPTSSPGDSSKSMFNFFCERLSPEERARFDGMSNQASFMEVMSLGYELFKSIANVGEKFEQTSRSEKSLLMEREQLAQKQEWRSGSQGNYIRNLEHVADSASGKVKAAEAEAERALKRVRACEKREKELEQQLAEAKADVKRLESAKWAAVKDQGGRDLANYSKREDEHRREVLEAIKVGRNRGHLKGLREGKDIGFAAGVQKSFTALAHRSAAWENRGYRHGWRDAMTLKGESSDSELFDLWRDSLPHSAADHAGTDDEEETFDWAYESDDTPIEEDAAAGGGDDVEWISDEEKDVGTEANKDSAVAK